MIFLLYGDNHWLVEEGKNVLQDSSEDSQNQGKERQTFLHTAATNSKDTHDPQCHTPGQVILSFLIFVLYLHGCNTFIVTSCVHALAFLRGSIFACSLNSESFSFSQKEPYITEKISIEIYYCWQLSIGNNELNIEIVLYWQQNSILLSSS